MSASEANRDAGFKSLTIKLQAFIRPHTKRIVENLTRVHNLIAIYDRTCLSTDNLDPTDILRAAVVLLHASLEDFLRSISSEYLPYANEEVLNSIPLVGLGESMRAEKFYLGKLVPHRGKAIQDLISECVEKHLERSNYNNTREIVALLKNIGFEVSEKLEEMLPTLDALMKRRHNIVHRADRVDLRSKEKARTSGISPEMVNGWTEATALFMISVLTELGVKKIKSER